MTDKLTETGLEVLQSRYTKSWRRFLGSRAMLDSFIVHANKQRLMANLRQLEGKRLVASGLGAAATAGAFLIYRHYRGRHELGPADPYLTDRVEGDLRADLLPGENRDDILHRGMIHLETAEGLVGVRLLDAEDEAMTTIFKRDQPPTENNP